MKDKCIAIINKQIIMKIIFADESLAKLRRKYKKTFLE